MNMSDVLKTLLAYGDRRAQEAADQVNSFLGGLTDRERRLVKEAAVMGYVQGARDNGGRKVPTDATIVVKVLIEAQKFSDLYPTLQADANTAGGGA